MVAEVGSIRVKFAADLGSYETSLRKGERQTQSSADRMAKAVGGLEARFGKMSGVVASFGKGLFAGIAAAGVSSAIKGLADVAKGVAEIGDNAKRAGVSATVFQEWAAVARNARIPVDSLADGLKELSLRGDEFALTGSGPAADAFKRLAFDAGELKVKLADPSALMLEIIDRLGQMDRAAQLNISDQIFGGNAGEKFVSLIDQGSQGIRNTINEAHALGNVLSDEVIARAAELDRQFNILTQTVGNNLKAAIVNAASALQQFIDSFRAFDQQQTANLEAQFTAVGKQRLDIENQILQVQQDQRETQAAFGPNANAAIFAAQIADLKAEQSALTETEKKIMEVTAARKEAAAVKPATAGPVFTPAPYTAPTASAPRATGGGGRSPATRTASASAADSEAKAVRDLIQNLQQELSLVGATDLQRETSNALRRAGAGATAAQKAEIVALIASINAEEEATRKATDAAAELQAIGRDVLGGIISDFRAGKDAGEVFSNVLDKIFDKMTNLALDSLFSSLGGGGGKGLLGGILIPGILHDGGTVGDNNKKVLVRHSGGGTNSQSGIKHNEVMSLLEKGETVFTAPQTDAIGAALDSSTSRLNKTAGLKVDIGIAADQNGNLTPFVAKIAQQTSAAAIRAAAPQIVQSSTANVRNKFRNNPGFAR